MVLFNPVSRRRLSNQAGFSLVELMIVMMVGAILVAMGGYAVMRALPMQRLNAASYALRHDLADARGRAMSTMREYGVGPSSTMDSWSVKMFDATPLPNGATPQEVTRNLEQWPGVEIVAMPEIIFKPRGIANRSADIILKHENVGTRTISVTMMGRVRIQ